MPIPGSGSTQRRSGLPRLRSPPPAAHASRSLPSGSASRPDVDASFGA